MPQPIKSASDEDTNPQDPGDLPVSPTKNINSESPDKQQKSGPKQLESGGSFQNNPDHGDINTSDKHTSPKVSTAKADAVGAAADKIGQGLEKNKTSTEKNVDKKAGQVTEAAVTAATVGSGTGTLSKVAGKTVEKVGVKRIAIGGGVVIAICLIPIIIVLYLIQNPWDAVRQVMTDSKLREFALDAAGAMARNLLPAATRALVYTGEVEYKGENTAIAAEPPATITPGSTLDKLTKVDWKKAQFQTLDNNDCGYELKLKQVVNTGGTTRYIPESVLNKRTRAVIPLEQLSTNTQAAYCIQKQYPIFNLMARQPVAREINQQADVHLSYASAKDTEEFKGDYQEVDQYVYDKTLDRITPSKEDTIDFTPYQEQLTALRTYYKRAVNDYNRENPNNPVPYDEEKSDIVAGINKMYEAMADGDSPYDLQVEDYVNIPTIDTGPTEIATASLANTLCPFVYGFLDIGSDPTNETTAENARNAIESRLGSTERGAIKINTLADTRKADQLSNVENNNTIRQQDNWASSTAYQLDVYNQLRGESQNPEATSTRSYNAKQTELVYGAENISALKKSCDDITSENSITSSVASVTLLGNYAILKRNILTNSEGYFESTDDFGMKEIITSYVRTGSVTSVSGLEAGPSNYNRQATGFRQLMNDYYLRIGGRFLTEQEAQAVAIRSEDTRRQEEKQSGIAYRLFDTKNIRSARSIIAQNTISPKTAFTATGGILKQILNPLRSLADIHSSLLYYTTGNHNRAFAASIDGDQYLKVDTAGVPEQDFNIDMLDNAPIIEGIKTSGGDADKRKLAHYDECFKRKVPTSQYFETKVLPIGQVSPALQASTREKYPSASYVAFFVFYPEYHRGAIDSAGTPTATDDPDGLYNKFFDCRVILQDAKDFSNPAYQLPIRYRMYTYYNTLLDQMVGLSSDEDNQSIYASSDAGTGTGTGVVGQADPSVDTSNTPCPNEPGITPDKVYQTYGPGQVPANKIMVCFVAADGGPIDINVSLASNLNKLIKDARAAGINFGGGGFRSYEEQISLRETNCGGANDNARFVVPSGNCSPPTAIPGTSNHEKGLAIDFRISGNTISGGSAGFNWLVENASKYGLRNLPSEAWHWSVDGS